MATLSAPPVGSSSSSRGSTDTLVVGAVGDIMLGSWVIDLIDHHGAAYPYAEILPLLERADILLGNLEAPFLSDTTGVERAQKEYTYAVPPRSSVVLVAGGFDVVTLANNHILDYGLDGLEMTWAVLDSIGIAHLGAGRSKAEAHTHRIVEREGLRLAFLAYNHTFPKYFWATELRPGTAHASDDGLAREVLRAGIEADLVVVSFHWSEELRESPKEYQQILAHIAIDNGADLVIGHHPHSLQPFEWYRGRLIAYSLGNFVFGSYSPAATGAALFTRFVDGVPVEADLYPLDVNNLRREFRPRPAPPSEWGLLGSRVLAALADSAAAGYKGVQVDPQGYIRLYPPRH